ncbi:MAG: DJ-1/PfpI family protein [Synergistaceae bacterium]|jgi:4-methyl-5(b-hydroxyethyl)-thiazole monophosphate biosynthesis|nr:DJ-1/PfpI family protein [Synergistaceae bacterium]
MSSGIKAALFMIGGFEETEALTTVDILRRGEIDVTTVSLGGSRRLAGRSRITVEADAMFSDAENEPFDMLVIPGGTTAYVEHADLLDLVRRHHGQGKHLAAICAAPAVFGKLGLLSGRRAIIFPGMEKWLDGAVISDDIVVTDGNITTSKGPGTTVYFALRLVEILRGRDAALSVAGPFQAQELKKPIPPLS